MVMEVKLQTPARADELGQQALPVQLRKRFAATGGDFELAVEFVIPHGIAILFGQSGAGKTTLLDCLAGLTNPDAGRIAIGDRVLFAAGINVEAPKRRVGYVFQDLALFPHLTVRKTFSMG